ncbi:transcriptional regulator, LacI family [Formivibrio citricus]|uniref:Transcriptional regulator, LacI family n=1 Tax=Formivibrio citricus TaxID=83765 RepID=A0A1I4WT99_9NEIS|nr:LacI family DNA-binding transcriptional regulator [Formivibrio citricus]SFN16199.1 transcriptional regulator, LacI family [Formivibrio citricus]
MPDTPPEPLSVDAGNPRPRSATIKDVARLAGLSPITVSRVLNNPAAVRPETIARVREAIAQTGYIPNLLAGSLVSGRSRLVAAIIPRLSNSMLVDFVQGLSDQLEARGYQLLLGLSGYPVEQEEKLLPAILSRRPDGVVLSGTDHSDETRQILQAAGIPIVETWDLTANPVDMVVGLSQEEVGAAMARFLLGKGRRRFGMIWACDKRARKRYDGAMAVLRAQGIELVPTVEVSKFPTMGLGRLGLSELLAGGEAFDAVMCSSDTLAQGVLTEAAARGISVPQQLAVMGFGDFDFSEHTMPPLSTIRVDKRRIGVLAANALLARMDGGQPAQRVIDVGFEIVERGTT